MNCEIGVVGLGVMGANLALNLERNGFGVAVNDHTASRIQELLAGPGHGKNLTGATSLAELVTRLEKPRRILLLVPAGAPVDSVLDGLAPHLEPGDVVVDGGNSHFGDTERRGQRDDGVHFCGMGVSGGHEGALWGPSLMPGGTTHAYQVLEPLLTRIAASTETGPCVTHVGARSAGHFVKMVHNGIEYGDMQLIAETYDILRNGLGATPAQIADLFAEWNEGELQSFLIEITSKIVGFPDDQGGDRVLIDCIADRAGQKGTGRWTTEAALVLGVPVPTMTAAVDARYLSSRQELRGRVAKHYPSPPRTQSMDPELLDDLRGALFAAKITTYAQGFDLLREAGQANDYGLRLDEVARIWKAGCIIRAALLDDIRQAFQEQPDVPNLLLVPRFVDAVQGRVERWRRTLSLAQNLGLPVPALSASLAYFDMLRSQRLPASLIQAQRDFFGAHGYQRTDREGSFHTDWSKTVS